MKYAAELVGTLILVLAGLGTAVLAGSKVGALGISLAFGLTLVAMAYSLGPISGCHINPAVTLGMLLSKRIKAGEAVGYMIVQVIGGIIGAGLVLAIAKGAGSFVLTPENFGINGYGEHSPGGYSLVAGFLAEALFTLLLVITVLRSTDENAPAGFAPLPIGLMLAVTNLATIPVTNASINPARSIGPAVFAGGWAIEQLWLFIVAPLVGGAVAAGLYMALKPAGAGKGKAAGA